MKNISLTPQFFELSKSDVISVPTTIKNKVLMAPGEWNGVFYTEEEIKKAFENTDWANKDTISVILDHADKPLSVHDWVGWVKNQKYAGGGKIIGDLELYDENTILKLVRAKAKFGISPRVKGMENSGEFKNFIFENFSVVTNPAVKSAYINLSQNVEGGKMEKETQIRELEEDEGEVEEEKPEEEKEPEEASAEEPEKKETKEMKCNKKKKYPEAVDEEPSDEEMLEITTNSDWSEFVSSMRKKYPKMSLKDIAKAFKSKSKEDAELEGLSERELLSRIDKLVSLLNRKKKYEKPEEEDINDTVKKMSQEISELKKRADAPVSITQELASESAKKDIFSSEKSHHSQGVLGMAEFLKQYVR